MQHIPKPPFITKMQVRTYECDYAQVVNNANYLHFFEQARHLFTLEHGIDTVQLAANGIVTVVASIEIKFIRSLQVNDCFTVHTLIKEYSPVRVIFEQVIYKDSHPDQPISRALSTIACVIQGKPAPFPSEIFGVLFI
ncbi:thioesterase family protein [Entomospira entomophila]|uniref:Acyl-CoA thioesterase n=1 Tax=Entomospira entomophila TaxID=2719988 RepID=A0A968GBL5_9SPIO|nr:thioesterase family protein [Entomospira entomophilus]NIZ39939.1 acyl-CoA thioesterase [Entomospira entomophilus]WDI35500.1 thioesterase family protein [Entomospira entomophilus]